MEDYNSKECPLPPSVDNLIKKICIQQSQPPPDLHARRELAMLGEHQALKILETIHNAKITKSFTGFIVYLVKKHRESSRCSSSQLGSSPDVKSLSFSPSFQGSTSVSDSCTSAQSKPELESTSDSVKANGSVISFFTDKLSSLRLNLFGFSNGHKPSREFMALEKLGFRRAFLVLSYIGGRKIEEVASVSEIRRLVTESEKLTLGSFENLVWERYGDQYCLLKDRMKYRNWDAYGQYYFYHCYVHLDGSYCFKGPFINYKTSLLQKVFKEEDVLIVKFVDEAKEKIRNVDDSEKFAAIIKVAKDGIYFGQKCYKFFAFKDGGRGEKDRTTSSVKCYFVNMDFFSQSYDIEKCPRAARSCFMHLDTLPNMSKYAARLQLVLSKTITLPINLDSEDVNVLLIDDIPCQHADGSVVKDANNKDLIHTDGTGYISEDLARGFPWSGFNILSDHDFERCIAHSLELKELSPSSAELPLLMQFRLFFKGYAVKGTVLVNRKLPLRTIQVRNSMVKVFKDQHLRSQTVNSFEVVAISGRPKKSYLSKYLISLLHYGGVPTEFFINTLKNAMSVARTSLTDKRVALQVALTSGDMDDDFTIARMILCGIPLNEPHLQSRLSFLVKQQNKGLKDGKLPIDESFYLMGTADPTGTLDPGEVCIVHENGQISGKVLVYRNPGIHFGDVHVLTAVHIHGLEEIVGNSKFGIFFPTKGSRSLPDAMAGGDLDGDMYWISRNLDLLKYFKQSDPWTCMSNSSSYYQKKPAELPNEELEHELFSRFLRERFQSSKAMGIASNSWLVHMDQLLTLEDEQMEERECLKENMLRLVDIYHEALDSPKTGVEVTVPRHLVANKYPHYMEKHPSMSYHSESVLGIIYDLALEWEPKTPSIPVWKLPLLDVEVSRNNLKNWQLLYKDYRAEMTSTYTIVNDEEIRRDSQNKVIQKYKQILYEAADLETSSKAWEEIRLDALAIYNVCYGYAIETKDAKKCGFAWRVAGEALLKILTEGQAEKPLACFPSVLQEILTRKTSQEQL